MHSILTTKKSIKHASSCKYIKYIPIQNFDPIHASSFLYSYTQVNENDIAQKKEPCGSFGWYELTETTCDIRFRQLVIWLSKDFFSRVHFD